MIPEIPQRVVSQSASAAALKRVLEERNARGKQLKRIGISGDTRERDCPVLLESFRGLVDDIC